MANYPGNKSITSLYPNIIGLFPPHRRYIELFAGSAAIFLRKKHVERSVLVDVNGCDVSQTELTKRPGTTLVKGCAIEWLKQFNTGSEDDLIYADPPYRVLELYGKRELYPYTLSDNDHAKFLMLARSVTCKMVISHYNSVFYDDILTGWSKKIVQVSYSGRVAEEAIYYNFPYDGVRHNSTYSGKNRTDRQRIKRKAARWLNAFNALPAYEQQAILEGLIIKK